ncbi:MAG: GGDEF domain-containing protein [Thalassotalea sp.]|nr:GGDEF domain-containing protein [Thalassotalea sp.]
MNSDIELTQVTEQLNSGILLLDLDLNVVSWNRFLAVHGDQKISAAKGKSVFDVFPELPKNWFECKVASVVQLGTPSFCSWEQRHHLFELPHTRPFTTDSDFMAQNCTFLPFNTDGKLTGICILIEDVTDVCHYQTMLKQTMFELEQANRMDGLTRIFNRKHWEDTLAKEFVRAKRYGNQLSLIMFDLDKFKQINDNYGHQCGDLVLTETASRISDMLREVDVFGRYGGEEFGILLTETNAAGAKEVGERIRTILSSTPVTFEKQTISFSACIGISSLNTMQTRYEDLISEADNALYSAKTSGRNQVCLAPSLRMCS